MTILNNNMNHASAAALVMNVFKKTDKVNFKSYHWTFTTKDGAETVEFIAGKLESKYIYTRVKKFLCFKLGVERVYLSNNDNELDMALWHQMGDVMHNTVARFGVNA